MTVRFDHLTQFAASCARVGVEPPSSIARGLHLLEVANAHMSDLGIAVLELSDEQARDRITELAVRGHAGRGDFFGSTVGMQAALTPFVDQLGREVHSAALPELEQLVIDLQPRFDEAAQPLMVAAQEFVITSGTTPAEILDRADEEASAAYREMRTAWHAIQPIVSFRIEMSRVFDLSPTPEEASHHLGVEIRRHADQLNWSAAFACGENWSLDTGFLVEGKRGNHLDWLALAATGVRLNTPEETRRKIAGRGDPLLSVLLDSVRAREDQHDSEVLVELAFPH